MYERILATIGLLLSGLTVVIQLNYIEPRKTVEPEPWPPGVFHLVENPRPGHLDERYL